MKTLTALLSIAALLACLVAVSLAEAEETEEIARPAGEKIFLEGKCSMCHTVVAAGIGEPRAVKGEGDVALPPDLSETGSSWTAEWLELYLQKKETIEGSKHKTKFKGSDEKRELLVEWLASLKAPAGDSTSSSSEADPAAEGSAECHPTGEKSSEAEEPAPATGAEPVEGD